MAIALQGTPSLYEGASVTSAVITTPAGVVAGELLIAAVAHSSSTAAPTTGTAGWTLLEAQNGVDAAGPSHATFYRVATGTEAASYTFPTNATAGRVTGIMVRISGVDTAVIQDVAAAKASTSTATSFTMPSISTVTANALLLHFILLNAASSADIVAPAGPTLVSKSTGTGRRMGVWSEPMPTAGASGTRLWTDTPATALQWGGITIALRPAGGVVGPSVTQRVVGITTTPTTSAVVSVKTANATSVRLKFSTDTAGTTGVVWSTAQTPSAQGDTKHTVTGLTANTQYYYRVAMTSSASVESLDALATIGKVKTAPSGAANFNFCFGSCESGDVTQALDAVAARGDDLFFHLGDLYYADGTATSVANFRTSMNNKIGLHQNLFATTNMTYTPSDHDGFSNNSAAGSDATAWTNWNTAVSELFPMSATYYAFTWGRVRFVQLDSRSFKSNPAATDDVNKTALGATQKQWLKNEITNATEPVIVIIQDAPWIGPAVAGDDGWQGYTTERTELANHFAASGKKIVMLGGDMHAVAADNGTNAPGGIYVFQAAPFNNTSSIKGGPYSEGTYPTVAGQSVAQYGRVLVTDDGSKVSLAFTGYSSSTNTARISLTTEVTVSPAGIPGAAVLGTPTLSSDATLAAPGIATSAALGTPTLTQDVTVQPTGIASIAFVGQPSMAIDLTVSPTAIPSQQAFGAPSVSASYLAEPVGIPGAAAIPQPSLSTTATASPTGIASQEAFGTAAATLYSSISPAGIPTKQFVGQPLLTASTTVSPAGIPSRAAVGLVSITGGGEFKTNYEISIGKKRWKGRFGRTV